MGLYVHCQKSFFGPNRKQTPDFMKSIDVIHCLFGLILLEFLYGRLSIEKAHMDFLLSKWRKKYFYRILRYQRGYIPYPRHCSPGVLFFNMGFWVGVNSKNPPKSGLFKQKVGVYSRKPPKTRLFTVPGAQFKSGAAMTRIRYPIYRKIHGLALFVDCEQTFLQ